MTMPPAGLIDKIYLGDSVYAAHDFDGARCDYIWIWTENGFGPNNDAIAIDQTTLSALDAYVKRIW